MFGLLLIYFIGKAFYDLAEKNKKKTWKYVIGGIVIYFGATMVVGLILGLLSEFTEVINIEGVPSFVLNIIGLPFGLLAAWGYHYYLRNLWSQAPIITDPDILDAHMMKE